MRKPIMFREPRSIEFTVPGKAKAERKRQRGFTSKDGRVFGHRTDEPDRKGYKARIEGRAFTECHEQLGGDLLHGPLSAHFVVCMEQPPSYPKNPTNGKPWPEHWIAKPDADNFAKLVSDALTGIVWKDDAQVTDLSVRKRYGDRDMLHIIVTEIVGGVKPPEEMPAL